MTAATRSLISRCANRAVSIQRLKRCLHECAPIWREAHLLSGGRLREAPRGRHRSRRTPRSCPAVPASEGQVIGARVWSGVDRDSPRPLLRLSVHRGHRCAGLGGVRQLPRHRTARGLADRDRDCRLPLQSTRSALCEAGIPGLRMRRRRRSSGGLPGRSLLLDEIGRWTTKRHPPPPCDPFEDFSGGRTGDFSLEDLLDVVGEVLAAGTRSTHEFSVKADRARFAPGSSSTCE